MQWLTLYIGLVAGAISAAAVWRESEIQSARRVAHHAKNSIANIRGLVWRLNQAIEKGTTPEELDYISERLSKLATRLEEMEKDVSQAIFEQQKAKTPFLLDELLEDVSTDTSHAFTRLNIQIMLADERLIVIGIRSDIYNAIWELITNAAYWTNQTGNVTISAQKVEANEIPRRLATFPSPLVKIDLIDDGPGIPRENREIIFNLGYSARGGTGYGLLFAREAIERCDGLLYADEPEGGKGAHFVILLPASA
jgi:signal transduction histidine kinase